MRTNFSISGISPFTVLLLSGIATLLTSCGGSGLTQGTTTPTSATQIVLSSTGNTVQSDNSDSVTVTATALNSGNSVVAGETLIFSTTAGQIGTSTGVTDSSGQVVFTFSGGATGINTEATITATAGSGASGTRLIQIVGSSLTLSSTSSSVASGTPLAITVSALDAGGAPVPNQPLRYSIAATSTGTATLSATTGTTSGAGTATVNVTGTAAGTIDVLVEWLTSTGTVSASATKTITISGTSAGTFAVTTPAASPDPAYIGTNENVVVSVPSSGVSNIRFATTLGYWNPNGQKIYTAPNPGTGSLTVSFNPGTLAGNANVQIDALDATGAVLSSQSFIFSVSAPSTSAASITLQSNVSILPLSSGANLSTATLTAMVRDASNSPVGGANVFFELVNSTGAGESISPVVVTTNSTSPQGQAQATFTAGTSSTTQGHAVRATVVGTAISAETPITVGGTAASVTLGLSTTVSIINSNTMYSLPVSVQVVDSNGNRVSGAVVSLSLWPSFYYKGERDINCAVVQYFGFANEDTANFLTLDPAEDVDGPGGYTYLIVSPPTSPSATTGAADGILWPAPSDAGAIPATVTTGADGTATFDWTYMKTYANWVGARIRATIQVQGTESSTDFYAMLRPAVSDVKSPCTLPDSPYN